MEAKPLSPVPHGSYVIRVLLKCIFKSLSANKSRSTDKPMPVWWRRQVSVSLRQAGLEGPSSSVVNQSGRIRKPGFPSQLLSFQFTKSAAWPSVGHFSSGDMSV